MKQLLLIGLLLGSMMSSLRAEGPPAPPRPPEAKEEPKEEPKLSTGERIEIPDVGFSIIPPNGWMVHKNAHGSSLLFEAPKQPNQTYQPTIQIMVFSKLRYIDEVTMKEYGDLIVEKFSKMSNRVTGYRLRDAAIQRLETGDPSILYYTEFQYDDVPIMQMHILISSATNHFVMTYTDMAKVFEDESSPGLAIAYTSMHSAQLATRPPWRWRGFAIGGGAALLLIIGWFTLRFMRARRLARLGQRIEDEDNKEITRDEESQYYSRHSPATHTESHAGDDEWASSKAQSKSAGKVSQVQSSHFDDDDEPEVSDVVPISTLEKSLHPGRKRRQESAARHQAPPMPQPTSQHPPISNHQAMQQPVMPPQGAQQAGMQAPYQQPMSQPQQPIHSQGMQVPMGQPGMGHPQAMHPSQQQPMSHAQQPLNPQGMQMGHPQAMHPSQQQPMSHPQQPLNAQGMQIGHPQAMHPSQQQPMSHPQQPLNAQGMQMGHSQAMHPSQQQSMSHAQQPLNTQGMPMGHPQAMHPSQQQPMSHPQQPLNAQGMQMGHPQAMHPSQQQPMSHPQQPLNAQGMQTPMGHPQGIHPSQQQLFNPQGMQTPMGHPQAMQAGQQQQPMNQTQPPLQSPGMHPTSNMGNQQAMHPAQPAPVHPAQGAYPQPASYPQAAAQYPMHPQGMPQDQQPVSQHSGQPPGMPHQGFATSQGARAPMPTQSPAMHPIPGVPPQMATPPHMPEVQQFGQDQATQLSYVPNIQPPSPATTSEQPAYVHQAHTAAPMQAYAAPAVAPAAAAPAAPQFAPTLEPKSEPPITASRQTQSQMSKKQPRSQDIDDEPEMTEEARLSEILPKAGTIEKSKPKRKGLFWRKKSDDDDDQDDGGDDKADWNVPVSKKSKGKNDEDDGDNEAGDEWAVAPSKATPAKLADKDDDDPAESDVWAPEATKKSDPKRDSLLNETQGPQHLARRAPQGPVTKGNNAAVTEDDWNLNQEVASDHDEEDDEEGS